MTTGTCAAACALASVLWQTKGICPESVSVDTPAGRRVCLEVIAGKYAECAVIKDAGDDPDITDGCVVRALVTIGSENGAVTFEAGQGIGTVTLPGLKVPVGEPAINPVPRQMIETHIRKVIGEKSARVVISIDDGERLAARTFNPRLGIVGGTVRSRNNRYCPPDERGSCERFSGRRTFSTQGIDRTSRICAGKRRGEGTAKQIWTDAFCADQQLCGLYA